MRQRALYAVLSCLCSACNLGEESSASMRPTGAETQEQTDPVVYRSRSLSFRLQQAVSRLSEPMPALARFEANACPDAQISARAKTERARTLVLDVGDARYEAHSLLPLRVTEPLKSSEATAAWNFFEPRSAPSETSPALGRLLKSEALARDAELEIHALETQNFKGVFHITEFKKAHLIRKKGKLRREWTRGLLRAWFAVYDLDTSEALCQTPLLVMSDVEDAPKSVRLAPETQRRLERELAENMRSAASSGLARISRELVLPKTALPEVAALPESSAGPREPEPQRLTLAQPPGMQ